MDFMFLFCVVFQIVVSRRNSLKNLWILLCAVSLVWFSGVICDDPESAKEELFTKSPKEPHGLRRGATSTSPLAEDWECGSVGACEDVTGYEAIRGLHRQLDDDANGSIDVSETDEFLRDELQYENGRHKERQKEFHGNDKYINVDELWHAWKLSEVHNWTVDQTVEWLINQVDLPQYEHTFRNNGVNGASLPLLAQNTHNFISYKLGIKDSIHKQKIALKAMDVVLFGSPKYHNYLKDALLVMSLVIAAGGCWFAYIQHKYSQTHMQKMMKDMEALQNAEDSLLDLQKELNKARHEQEIVSIEKQDLERRLQDEIITARRQQEHLKGDSTEGLDQNCRLLELERELQLARNDLRDSEKKLEARHWVAPTALQQWLQLTHELELRNYNAKKAIAEQQLLAAKEGCEKLSKKRATFMGAFRIAHGSSIDDVDDRIVKAKAALCEVTTDLQERMNRWKQVELLCGVPIILNAGLAHLETILKLRKVNGATGSTHSGIATLSKSSSDTTVVREESPPPYTGLLPSSISNIPPPYTKSSPPPFTRQNAETYVALTKPVVPAYQGAIPKEIYRPYETMSSFDADREESQLVEMEEDAITERSITPPPPLSPVSTFASPESSRALFTVGEGSSGETQHPPQVPRDTDPLPASQLSLNQSNGKMGDFVRKISTSLLSDKKRRPGMMAVEALKKSASSSNITDAADASSESSSSVVTDEKVKTKKKFFQTLRHRKPKS